MPRLNAKFPSVIVSCAYKAISFTSVCPRNGKRVPPAVRSKGGKTAHGSGAGLPFGQPRLVRKFGPKPSVRQRPMLIESGRGAAGNEAGAVCENVSARVVVKHVPPHKRS